MTAPPLHVKPAPGAAEPAEPAEQPAAAGREPTAAASGPVPLGPDWRRWRVPLTLIGFIVLGGIVTALVSRLISPPAPNGYLDPASQYLPGAHALADILGERGSQVVRVYSPSSALAAVEFTGVGSAGQGDATAGAPTTLLITSPYLLTGRQRERLARARADLFLVEPGPAALSALAPGIHVAARARDFGRALHPRCDLAAAQMAGSANVGGLSYTIPARAVGCYPVDGGPSVVRFTAAGRTITILGSGVGLTNALLARNGNAALVLNLLGPHRRVVWLTPEPSGPGRSRIVMHPGGSPPAAQRLIPWAAWLLVIQLGVAVAMAALWRSRRLGPLITERLPVVVRASETVEGHARLYQSRRARERAAAALRGAMLSRVLAALGLVRGVHEDAVIDALAARSRLNRPEIAGIVYGPAPADDAELVRLARSLDELEREVRSQ